MKSFFMEDLHTINNKSLTSTKICNTANNIDRGTVDSLQIKIILLETENKLLKDDVKNNPVDTMMSLKRCYDFAIQRRSDVAI